jgi:hypothetical protein
MIIPLAHSILTIIVYFVLAIILVRFLFPLAYLDWLTDVAQRIITLIRYLKSRVREHIRAQYTPEEWEHVKHRFDDAAS